MHDRPRRPAGSAPRASTPGATTVAGPAHRVIELQQAAGNRAVAGLLARAPKKAAKPPPKIPAGNYVKVPGVGYIEIESFSWDSSQGRRPLPAGGRAGSAPHLADMMFTGLVGVHSTKLMELVATGGSMDLELVLQQDGKPYMRCAIGGALFTSYTTGGGHGSDKQLESWGVSATDVKYEMVQR